MTGRALRVLMVTMACAASALLAGFVVFAAHTGLLEAPDDVRAEAIVALTGGDLRIHVALDLLTERRGERLLITGVHPSANEHELGHLRPDFGDLFSCCIDLDYEALDTIGNAEETRRWTERHGFRSLIVVTSGYHMPRSMTVLGRILQDVELIAYPVVSPDFSGASWWRDGTIMRLLFIEYAKYLITLAPRLRAAHLASPPDLSAAAYGVTTAMSGYALTCRPS